jgi:DNA-binding SARP family transcriptional activator
VYQTAGPTLHLLGGFELKVGARPHVVSPAAQRLLTLLAVQGGQARRGWIRAQLWPDLDVKRASSNLRSTLWRLPRPDGRAVFVGSPDTVTLANDVRVDLWTSIETARTLTSGATEECDRLAADHELFDADLLPGWGDQWLSVDQESYRQLRFHALERLSALHCRAERYPDALLAALAAVRGEPLRESAHRHVIAVHLAEGNPSEALRQYHTCRRLLASELGIPPSVRTRSLVRHLLGRPVD